MKISIVVPWHNKKETLQSLQGNRAVYEREDVQLVFVNAGGVEGAYQEELKKMDLPNCKYVYYTVTHFNKSTALNVGVAHADYDYLLFQDADVILSDFMEALQPVTDRFITAQRVQETSPAMTMEGSYIREIQNIKRFVTTDGQTIDVNTGTSFLWEGDRSGPGIIFMQKSDFLELNGMNAALTDWGWEDCELILRLLQKGLTREESGAVKHITHEVGQAQNSGNNFRRSLSKYIVKDFKGTYQSDMTTEGIELITLS